MNDKERYLRWSKDGLVNELLNDITVSHGDSCPVCKKFSAKRRSRSYWYGKSWQEQYNHLMSHTKLKLVNAVLKSRRQYHGDKMATNRRNNGKI